MDMSNATTRSGSLNGRLGLVALLASMCLIAVALFGASSAKASTIGDPVDVDFNYAGIDVQASLGGISDFVLTPDSALGNVEMRGHYTSTDGDFLVPKSGGLNFPPISVDLGVALDAEIGLEEDATGNYNSATGAMTMNPKIYLTLGVADLGALLGGSLGTGPLGLQGCPAGHQPLDLGRLASSRHRVRFEQPDRERSPRWRLDGQAEPGRHGRCSGHLRPDRQPA